MLQKHNAAAAIEVSPYLHRRVHERVQSKSLDVLINPALDFVGSPQSYGRPSLLHRLLCITHSLAREDV